MSTGLIAPPRLGGWTRSMLIELADRRTERRGSKTLDLNSEFLMALQFLCMELRWSWRRKVAVFQMQPGKWQYDLTLVPPQPVPIVTPMGGGACCTCTFTDGPTPIPIFATYNLQSLQGLNVVGDLAQILGTGEDVGTPVGFFNGIYPITAIGPGPTVTVAIGMSPGQNLGPVTYSATIPGGTLVDYTQVSISPDASDLHQFVKHGVKYYPSPGNPSQWGEITPMFERDLQTAAIYANLYSPQPGYPRQYFIHPGAFLVLDVTPVPTGFFPITIDYWAVPQIVDSLAEQIPLVPAFLHNVLLKRLEAQIFRYTLGEGAAKYQAAMAEYSALVAKYSAQDGMVPGEHMDYSADDDYESPFANAQSAVQSTS